MWIRKSLKFMLKRKQQLILFSSLSAFFLIATVPLTFQVYYSLGDYRTTRTGNLMWATTQLEVDHLKFTNSIKDLNGSDTSFITTARQRFNSFYSRTTILKESEAYQAELTGTEATLFLKEISDAVYEMSLIIDDTNNDILQKRETLLEISASISVPIRKLISLGLTLEAGIAERERKVLTDRLLEISFLSLMLLTTLLSLVILLWRISKLYIRRASENRGNLQRLSTMLNTSQDAVLVVQRNGEIADYNDVAKQMFSITSADGQSKVISDILVYQFQDSTPHPVSGETLFRACDAGPKRCDNYNALTATGGETPVELSMDMASRSGLDICVCFIRDISHRITAEAEIQLAQEQALAGERTKTNFLNTVSHEMRTPLQAILGALDLMHETDMNPEQRRYSRTMQTSGQLLLKQINDVLDIALHDNGQLHLKNSIFGLDELLIELIQNQKLDAKNRKTHIKFMKPEAPLGHVYGDADRVLQILLNIISNAVKFTQDGEITIEVSRISSATDNDGIVEFQISDTGIGISEEDIPRVFDDFVRLGSHDAPSVAGSGLGLGIVKNLVTLMNGEIGLESIKGEGTLFWVRLSLPQLDLEQSILTEISQVAQAPMIRKLNILVAEDNPTSRYILAEMLVKDGHSVTQISDGSAAVVAAQKEKFDLILMDISMPKLDGIEAIKHIRTGNGASSKSKICVLTAHINAVDKVNKSLMDADGAYAKPLSWSVLRTLLADIDTPTNMITADHQNIVDPHVMEQLQATLPPSKVHLLMQRFFTEGEQFMKNIHQEGDLSGIDLRTNIHKFAGTAATFGATMLHTRLSDAESAILADNYEDYKITLRDVWEIWDETKSELEQFQSAA